ncbi:WxL protein peptidoglycan domain-containing protein [Streptomyces sp. NPDC059524]|uniref:WxL protein peptidoglycan domain-containing protein n=1 Tax=Streptomyces sp. NPDC059524 TaxID=3346856 RepID=UPI00369AA936
MRKPSRAVLLLLLLGCLLSGAPAQAADNGSWSVFPYATELARRPYFHLSADPGDTLRDRVVVANKTARPLTFRLYAADAYNTARDGGFAVRTRKEKQRGVGVWARPARTRVTVPPRGRVTVPITIKVPERAEPGDHPGAIVALDERVDRGDGSLALGVQRAVAARVYLRVSGPTMPAISVEQVKVEHSRPMVPGTGPSTAVISYTLRNRGNVTLDPSVRLHAGGLFGRTLLARSLSGTPAELLPGQRVRLTTRWNGAPQFDRGDITLTASARETRESASVSYLALPWVFVLVVAALLVTGATLTVRARRSRRGAGHI